MAALTADRVSVRYPGQAQPALDGVSLNVGPGELAVALGPSGCGKTTLLNLFAGFQLPDSGSVRFGGAPVAGPGAERAVVFQQHALLPWLSALDNVAFGLRLRGVPRAERRALAERALEQVDLAEAGSRYPWQLSGGQKQRVGIARALAGRAGALLMDEPFGALDAFTREQMQELLLKVWAESGSSVFLITHDIEEALFLATELVLMSPGPGRIVKTLRPPFSRRWRAGDSARAIKSDPEFIALREQLLADVFAQRRQEAWA
ncbi:taurine ABC transporter ATP-binding subunit [Pseudogulbenkiania ferrooxidans]|uniref:Molybdenum ABC transporter ATPase n=1 Tax=Pseudogulbenkiania ferrooxidans EGD-HP2 TaxID=1388764 RepID=A0ABN0N6C7_9NEIS|nr:taurine ABC transporter ATP-binding subunit [Pseudogulbenkiania ferrooxidans]ERE06406.1 molybdenum ABC transporter ATPase [Pseudogulbenkiania ferrooxidans EGD-HP2]